MFGVDSSEFLLCLLIAVVVIGPKDLPGVLRTVGKWVGKARGMANQFRMGLDQMVRETEIADLEKKWREQNEQIMRSFPTVDSKPEAAWDGTHKPAGDGKPVDGAVALDKPSDPNAIVDLGKPDGAAGDWADSGWGQSDPMMPTIPAPTGTPGRAGSRPPVTGQAPVTTRARVEGARVSAARPSIGPSLGPSLGKTPEPVPVEIAKPSEPPAVPPMGAAPPRRRAPSRRPPRSGGPGEKA